MTYLIFEIDARGGRTLRGILFDVIEAQDLAARLSESGPGVEFEVRKVIGHDSAAIPGCPGEFSSSWRGGRCVREKNIR